LINNHNLFIIIKITQNKHNIDRMFILDNFYCERYIVIIIMFILNYVSQNIFLKVIIIMLYSDKKYENE